MGEEGRRRNEVVGCGDCGRREGGARKSGDNNDDNDVLKQVLPAYEGDRFAIVDPHSGQNRCSTM